MIRDNRIRLCRHSGRILQFTAMLCVLLMLCTLLSGCNEEGSKDSTGSYYGKPSTDYQATSADLYCLEITRYSGPFVEDGKDDQVESVAAILVENTSAQFLDRATVTYSVGDETATFVVTGLPPDSTAWVLESNRMTLDAQIEFEFLDCVSAFRSDAIKTTDLLEVSAEDNVITVTNVSSETLNNVCLYYKNVNSDGNYLGGITYMIAFDTLKAGESAEKASAHYSHISEIVRYSYQTE